MAQSQQDPDDLSLRARPRNSWIDIWLPAVFGTAPSRLFKLPPKPKPLDHIYGLNEESIFEHVSTSMYPKDSNRAQSRTSGDTQTVHSSRTKSWHSSTSVTMKRSNIAQDAVPSALAWTPSGEVDKDTSLDEVGYKSQDGRNKDNVSGQTTNDTILLTRSWEIQGTLQYTRKTRTPIPKQKKQLTRKLPTSIQTLDQLRAWNKVLERRQHLRRRASSMAKPYTTRYKKTKAVTDTAYVPKNTSIQNQDTEPAKQSQCCSTDNSGDTVQRKTKWPNLITTKIWKPWIYFAVIASLLASCFGIAAIICKLTGPN